MTQKNNRPWGKTELALAYTAGSCSPRMALNWLNDEIRKYPGLMAELQRLGYRQRNKRFTLAQVQAIFRAIGEP